MLPIAKLSAAHSAIATRRGVVNMGNPQAHGGLEQQGPGPTRKIGLLDLTVAKPMIAHRNRGRHVPIRDRGAEAWPRSGGSPCARNGRPRAAGAAHWHRADPRGTRPDRDDGAARWP